jgi:thiol-disulfide isomerase/thioredoxin
MPFLKTGRFYLNTLTRLGLIALFAATLPAAHARDFSAVDTAGKTHTLKGHQGKWVLVNYWATWCPPCLKEIPDLADLHANPKNNLVVLGIALDWKNKKQVTDFATKLKVNYPVILGDRALTAKIGPVDGLPMTYLFNPQGKLVAQQAGAITRAAVESFIHAKK